MHGELNHIIVTLRHMITPVDRLALVNVGGGCYKVVSEHGSILGLDEWSVFVMHACRLYMCLLCMHGDGHFYNCVVM